jgi:hypothetical protein
MLIGAGCACCGAPPVAAATMFSRIAGDLADPAIAGRDASRDTVPEPDLRASTAVPWIPERPDPMEPWETAVRLPGRVAALPLTFLGQVTKRTMIQIEASDLIPTVAYYVSVLPQFGFVLTPASLGDRTGFGLKAGCLLPPDSRWFAAQVEGSTSNYSSTRLSTGYGPARLEYGYDWRPREQFFGIGLKSDRDDVTTYATQSQHVRVRFDRTFGRARAWPARLSAWMGPRQQVTRRGREGTSFEQVFPSLAASLDQRTEHLVYGGRVVLDGRRGTTRWSHGARLEVEAERHDDPVEALALGTSKAAFRFTRLEYLAEWGASFYRDPRTIRLLVRVVDDRPDASGTLPIPELARLGGSEGLSGFEPGRFRDTDLVLGKVSYLFPLSLHLEFDLHAEAGAVYGDVWRDPKSSTLEPSYGLALRPRLDTGVLGKIGLDWSREGTRVGFSLGGVE